MSIKELTAKQLAVWQSYSKQGTIEWNYDIAIQDLTYQIGSLAKLNLQMKNYRYHDGLSLVQIHDKITDELTDILADVFFIAHELNIDLDKAFENMLQSDINKITSRSKVVHQQ